MQKGDPSGQQQQNIQRRRRSQSKFNKDLPRYECFCSKQYLSYPALYLHMKNKHIDYFQSSKNGRVEPTKLIESFNPAEGYKVYKIGVDSAQKEFFATGGKFYDPNFLDNTKQGFYMNQSNTYMGYSNLAYPNYNFIMGGEQINEGQKKLLQREAVIQSALHMFMQTLKNKPSKQKHEVQLLFALLVDCINKNYQILKDPRILQKQVHRYTAQFNSEKIMSIIPYFQQVYLPSAAQQSKPSSFFVKNSHIITSGQYKAIMLRFNDFVSRGASRRPATTERIVPAPQPPFSDNEAQSENPSQNEEQEEDQDEPYENDEDQGDQS